MGSTDASKSSGASCIHKYHRNTAGSGFLGCLHFEYTMPSYVTEYWSLKVVLTVMPLHQMKPGMPQWQGQCVPSPPDTLLNLSQAYEKAAWTACKRS